jgi:uncharacterized protein (TIGR02145 family)
MRKLILTTAAVAAAIAGAFAAEPSFGTFTDTRDGQKYKTVKIGKQTWMAQNINYQTKGGSWCYEDSASYCKQYGRLYDWKTAKTVCPKGWKLPSREDWDSLGQAVRGKKELGDRSGIYWYGAGKKLKSKSGWIKNGNGTDDYGFSALPGGNRGSDGGFGNAGNGGGWWTATEDSDGNAYGRGMGYDNDDVHESNLYKSLAFSARCVQDSE